MTASNLPKGFYDRDVFQGDVNALDIENEKLNNKKACIVA